MLTLDNQTKALIIGGLVLVAMVPKPSLETIKGWLSKLKPAGPSSFSFKSLIIPALSIFFLLSETPVAPPTPPEPVPVVQTDLFDKCCADYRDLLSEVWTNYGTTRPTLKTEAEQLKLINELQTAAYTAAFQPYIDRATAAAAPSGSPAELSKALKEKSLQ